MCLNVQHKIEDCELTFYFDPAETHIEVGGHYLTGHPLTGGPSKGRFPFGTSLAQFQYAMKCYSDLFPQDCPDVTKIDVKNYLRVYDSMAVHVAHQCEQTYYIKLNRLQQYHLVCV